MRKIKLNAAAVILFAHTSAPGPVPVEEIFNQRQVPMRADARFVKLTVSFAGPVALGSIRVEACNGEFNDGAEFFFSPGGVRIFSEGGHSALTAKIGKAGEKISSFAIQFRHNQKVCLKALRLADASGKAIETQAPLAVAGTVSGADGAEKLSDSLTSTFVEAAEGKTLTVAFAEQQSLDRVRVWGMSKAPAKLTLGDGGNFRAQLSLPEEPVGQDLRLEKPFKGQKLTLKTDSDLEISELRFGRAETIVSLSDPQLRSSAEKRAASFASPGLAHVLDHQLEAGDERDKWLFRFRSDGTFFVYGKTDEFKAASRFSAQGNYKIENAGKRKLRLSLEGKRWTGALPWDGPEEKRAKIVELRDNLVLEKTHGAQVMIRNRTAPAQRKLPFTDFAAKTSSLQE